MLNLGDGRETPTHYNNVEIKAQENEISMVFNKWRSLIPSLFLQIGLLLKEENKYQWKMLIIKH